MLKKIGKFFKNLERIFLDFKGRVKENPKVLVQLIRNVTFFAIIFILAFVGIYFILQVDLLVDEMMWKVYFIASDENANQGTVVGLSKSLCLFIAIILTFGSAIVSGFSEFRKDKPKLVFILKGLSLILVISFIIFVYGFETIYLLETAHKKIAVAKTVSLVFGYIGIGTIIINIVSNAYLGIEE